MCNMYIHVTHIYMIHVNTNVYIHLNIPNSRILLKVIFTTLFVIFHNIRILLYYIAVINLYLLIGFLPANLQLLLLL